MRIEGKTETSQSEEKNDEEKKKQGWKKYNDMGIEFKISRDMEKNMMIIFY